MKPIRDLEKALNNPDYYADQFNESGHIKNILFVSPQIKGKHVYKFLLPYYSMRTANVETAITSVEKFDEEQLFTNPKSVLFPKQVLWADFIVFPFMINKLGGAENSVYQELKKINPNVKIVYHVDFNFYTLPKLHPYKKYFNKKVVSNIEDNIYFSDLCLTSNLEFNKFLIQVIEKLAVEKYKDIPPQLKVGSIPILFDTDILLMNVDYDPERAKLIDNRRVQKTAKVSEEEKKKSGTKKSTTSRKTTGSKSRSASKSTTKKTTAKSTTKKTTTKKTNDGKSGAKSGSGKPNGGTTAKSGGKSTGGNKGGSKSKTGGTTTRRRGRPPKSETSTS
jgi:hypothetical protein